MAYKSTFKRYELKYMITLEQKELILEAMAPYMKLDKYGRTTIRNIYYDTENFRLIRRSIEKPMYKEKLRVRTYYQVTDDQDVFVEIKKKYNKVVYKRRLTLPESTVTRAFAENTPLPVKSQIGDEIEYFRKYYETLYPAVFLTYEREAYYMTDGSEFRVTFDDTILYRTEDVSLRSTPYGTPILKEGMALMEIKTPGGIPLWMVEVLSREKIYKTSFSKYGTAYADMLSKNKNRVKNTTEGEVCYV